MSQLDDVTAYRIRKLALELRDLEPELLDELLEHPKYGSMLGEALGTPTPRWTCPLCSAFEHSATPPTGWVIVTPFTRVAACNRCAPHFYARLRRQLFEGLEK